MISMIKRLFSNTVTMICYVLIFIFEVIMALISGTVSIIFFAAVVLGLCQLIGIVSTLLGVELQ